MDLEASGSIWKLLDDSGGFRKHLEASGSIWRLLEASGSLWKLLDAVEGFWELLEASGGLWMPLEAFGRFCELLETSGRLGRLCFYICLLACFAWLGLALLACLLVHLGPPGVPHGDCFGGRSLQ